MSTEPNTTGLDLLETPGHLLRRCQQRAHEIFREMLGGFGLTQQQTALLIALARRSDASIQDLADVTGTDRNTLGDVVARLIDRGLLERRRAPADARAYELRVSASGAQLLRRMAPGLAEVQRRILAPLRPAERAAFVRMARSIALPDAVPASATPGRPRPAARRRSSVRRGTGRRRTRSGTAA
ncbi:MAG: MarR family winged helix-turn-helix transcriptional regulator [Burkholderiales bacterium]|nr:MarR family winged helix-turn-helix transcriptional regulator [Burkholderiales bacterium]